MKADRRHELETNDLAKKIVKLPDYTKQYAGRILLAVVVIGVVLLLVQYRMKTKQEDLATAQNGISSARSGVAALAALNPLAAGASEVAARRQSLISNVLQALDSVQEHSEDSKMLAQALMLKGDLFWTVANLPELPGASTRPSLAVDPKPSDALDQAEAAYKQVLDQYSDQKSAGVPARFGLAAIAENRGKWAEARNQYEQIKKVAEASVYQKQADNRLTLLKQIEASGVFLISTTLPTTMAGATTQAIAH